MAPTTTLKLFPAQELAEATSGFSPLCLIGEGESSTLVCAHECTHTYTLTRTCASNVSIHMHAHTHADGLHTLLCSTLPSNSLQRSLKYAGGFGKVFRAMVHLSPVAIKVRSETGSHSNDDTPECAVRSNGDQQQSAGEAHCCCGDEMAM